MSQAKTEPLWRWDEYLAWEQRQDRKHELVDGRVQAMVGGTAEHDTICNNLRRELGTMVRGQRCRVQGPDLKVRAGQNSRYPDALIDCGERVRGPPLASEPVAVFEVLSKSTAWVEQTLKLRDYDSVASIRYYVLIGQDEPRVLIHTRDEGGRLDNRGVQLLESLSDSLTLLDPAIVIPLQTLYEGVGFEA